jgi:YegS/Rv2252/BmrU family lipid kinase
MPRYKIIVNPVSGRGAGERSIPKIRQLMRQHRLDFDLTRTERPWHAVELAQQAVADGFDAVVAAGGDGTANEVLNGLMLTKQSAVGPVEVPPVGKVSALAVGQLPLPVALGVLCVGRGNDMAYGMGIPGGLEAGCAALARNYRRTVDVGCVRGGLYPEGRYFANGIGIGFDAVVGFVAAKMKLTGFMAYIVAALETMFLYYRAPRVRIAYNGRSIELSALMVSIMNGRRMGGGFMMAPQGQVDDALFDVCIARQVSRPRILALIPKFMRGDQTGDPAIQMVRAQRLVITALEGVLPAHADGETLCTDARQLSLDLLPGQLEILCQPPE